jgi:Tetratricopeptide repeat
VLGPEHADTVHTRDSLASACRADGRIPESITLHEQNLVIREREFGPDDPDTLSSGLGLARAFSAAGRPASRTAPLAAPPR